MQSNNDEIKEGAREFDIYKKMWGEVIHMPIPKLDSAVGEMFSGKDKKWKSLKISEELTEKPKKLKVISNTPYIGRAMAWPAYYKNPRLGRGDSGLGELAYMAHGRLQASPLVKVRADIAERLNLCQDVLDSNRETSHLQIVVVDGYRSLKVQKVLFETYRGYVAYKHPEMNDEELDLEAQKMVSIPPSNKEVLRNSPPPHSTGAAVDLILVEKSKVDIKNDGWLKDAMIDFGSGFDEMMHPDFGDARSETRFFEGTGTEAEKNRILLYNLMTKIGGFSNYHFEWWHYDLDNQFDAASTGKPLAKYGFAGGVNKKGEVIDDLGDEFEALERYKTMVGGKVDSLIEGDFGIAA